MNVDPVGRGVIGTGFFIRVPFQRGGMIGNHRYVVTADHVLTEQFNIEIRAHNNRGELGAPYAIPIKHWCRPLPGYDLAIAPLTGHPGPGPTGTADIDDLAVTPPHLGAAIVYAGILTALNKPVTMARSGTIAARDVEGLKFDHHFSFPAHLVDCRSYDGFSGSPCYSQQDLVIVDPPAAANAVRRNTPRIAADIDAHVPGGQWAVGHPYTHIELVGMFTNHTTELDDPRPADKDSTGHRKGAINRYGIGVMLRATDIRRALLSDELEKHRIAIGAD